MLLLSYLIEEADGEALPVLHRGSHWGEVGHQLLAQCIKGT